MKLAEAIQKVDRNPENAPTPDMHEFLEALCLNCYPDYTAYADTVKAYWLTHHLCTDTWVGPVFTGTGTYDPLSKTMTFTVKGSTLTIVFDTVPV